MTRIQIRRATVHDRDGIGAVHTSAFRDEEPAAVVQLAGDLLQEQTTPETFALVAEAGHKIIGHVGFSPLFARGEDVVCRAYILAPLGVLADEQKRGVGTELVRAGIQALLQDGIDLLFVYGDPAYYRRFGFEASFAERYLPPYALRHPFGWQALALRETDKPCVSVPLDCVCALRHPVLW